MPAHAATANSRLSLSKGRGPVPSSSQEPSLLPGWVKGSPVVVMPSSVPVVMEMMWVVAVVMGGASGAAVVTTMTWVETGVDCWPSWEGDVGGRGDASSHSLPETRQEQIFSAGEISNFSRFEAKMCVERIWFSRLLVIYMQCALRHKISLID